MALNSFLEIFLDQKRMIVSVIQFLLQITMEVFAMLVILRRYIEVGEDVVGW